MATHPFTDEIPVVGGGLAGSEAVWQLSERGFRVALHVMRPGLSTLSYRIVRLAVYVCTIT